MKIFLQKKDIKIGTQFMTSGKFPKIAVVVDILKTYNCRGEHVKTTYIAEHDLMGKRVKGEHVATTIQIGHEKYKEAIKGNPNDHAELLVGIYQTLPSEPKWFTRKDLKNVYYQLTKKELKTMVDYTLELKYGDKPLHVEVTKPTKRGRPLTVTYRVGDDKPATIKIGVPASGVTPEYLGQAIHADIAKRAKGNDFSEYKPNNVKPFNQD